MSVPGAWFGTVFGQFVGGDHLGVGERGKSGFDVWCVCVCQCACVMCVCVCVCVCYVCACVCVLPSVHLLQ